MTTIPAKKQRKVSEGIENTLEGFLQFLLRYFYTMWVISVAPHRSMAIAFESRRAYSNQVHALTFLAVGSFLFALLIDVYPNGISGLIDFIWITDEINQNIGANWEDALSPVKMITSGLPIILMVSICGAFTSKLVLKKGMNRELFFDVICLAYGYQCTLIFLVFSIESSIQVIQIIFSIPNIDFSEDGGLQYGVMIFFLTLLSAVIIMPLIMISGALVKSRNRRAWLKRKWSIYVISFFLSLVIMALYTNAGSVPAKLKEKNTPKEKISGHYLKPIELRYDQSSKLMSISILFAIKNPTKEAPLIESDDEEFQLTIGNDEDEFIHEWSFTGTGLRYKGVSTPVKWLAIEPVRSAVIGAEFSQYFELDLFCKLIERISKTLDDNTHHNIYGKYTVSFLSESEDIELDEVLNLNEMIIYFDDEEIISNDGYRVRQCAANK